jgi:hypothetical protein
MDSRYSFSEELGVSDKNMKSFPQNVRDALGNYQVLQTNEARGARDVLYSLKKN